MAVVSSADDCARFSLGTRDSGDFITGAETLAGEDSLLALARLGDAVFREASARSALSCATVVYGVPAMLMFSPL